MHLSCTLQTGHGSADGEGLTGFDSNKIFAAVHNLCNNVPGPQIHILQFTPEAQVNHLRGRDKKGVRGLGTSLEGPEKTPKHSDEKEGLCFHFLSDLTR